MERIQLSAQLKCAAKSTSWIGVESQGSASFLFFRITDGYQGSDCPAKILF